MADPETDHVAQAPERATAVDSEGDVPRIAVGSGDPGTEPTCFAIGAFVGGRYRIVRFIARGGMGEVYETEDLLRPLEPSASRTDPPPRPL